MNANSTAETMILDSLKLQPASVHAFRTISKVSCVPLIASLLCPKP